MEFEGERRKLTSGLSDFRRIDFNDRAMNLRLPPSSSWQICADINFVRGTVVNSDWPDLGTLSMRNQISSARPWNAGGGGGRGPFQPTRFRLVLYEDRGTVSGNVSDLGSVGLRNEVSSLRPRGSPR